MNNPRAPKCLTRNANAGKHGHVRLRYASVGQLMGVRKRFNDLAFLNSGPTILLRFRLFIFVKNTALPK